MYKNIDTLCLQGGGCKDIVIIGALRILEERGILQNIKNYAGSSAGAIIITLLCIGYTPNEIEDTIFSQNSKLVNDLFIKIPFHLLFKYGLYDGMKMVKYIEKLFIEKGFDPNITFEQLNKRCNKILVLTGTSLNIMDTFYFNCHTTPDMKVIDALRISISIPLFFTSVEYIINSVKHTFVDGGVLNNCPMYYFNIVDETGKYILTCKELIKQKLLKDNIFIDCSNTIGIMYLDTDQSKNVDDFYQGFNIINNIYQYCVALLDTLLIKIQEDNFRNPLTGSKENFFRNIICVKLPFKVNAVNFDLPQEQKDLLVKAGEDAAKEYFNLVKLD